MLLPDTNIVDLHRTDGDPRRILGVQGRAWLVSEGEANAVPVELGQEVSVGDTLILAEGATVELTGLVIKGGNRGRAHAMVSQTAFRSSPNRTDVPRLLQQLAQINREMKPLGEDPLTMQPGPQTPYERAMSAEFARLNLDLEVARGVDEAVARDLGAVCLFISEETAFVALGELSVPKLERLMRALDRPVNPHLVEPVVLEELLNRVYSP